MLTVLNDVEVRILGALVEKQVTTPEYYPLTLNALTLACNQKNNRQPVTGYDEAAVAQALETLREKNLAYVFYGSGSRVPKYKHVMPEILDLNPAELAIMCVLMLRGPQTVGELRERASRLHEFASLEQADETLNSLVQKDPDPLIVKLPRQSGQKESRYAHLLNGPIDVSEWAETEPVARPRLGAVDRTTQLEQEVEALREEVRNLARQFEEFRHQFD